MESRAFAVSPWRSSDRPGWSLLRSCATAAARSLFALPDTATFAPAVNIVQIQESCWYRPRICQVAYLFYAMHDDFALFRACMGGVLLALRSFVFVGVRPRLR